MQGPEIPKSITTSESTGPGVPAAMEMGYQFSFNNHSVLKLLIGNQLLVASGGPQPNNLPVPLNVGLGDEQKIHKFQSLPQGQQKSEQLLPRPLKNIGVSTAKPIPNTIMRKFVYLQYKARIIVYSKRGGFSRQRVS